MNILIKNDNHNCITSKTNNIRYTVKNRYQILQQMSTCLECGKSYWEDIPFDTELE